MHFYDAPSIAKLEIKDGDKNQWNIIGNESHCGIIIKNEYHVISDGPHLKFDNESNTFKPLDDFAIHVHPPCSHD